MKQKFGYYGLFMNSCAKYSSNIAVRLYDNGQYKNYTYSELYGVCEYICQNLQQLHTKKGIIGLISERNILIPCVIAAAHKCSTTFMFLDPTQDIRMVLNKINIKTVIAIGSSGSSITSQILSKSPDITLSIFNLTISIYNFDMKISQSKNSNINKHSFICMTSGSTGEKKHIQVPVQCILPNIEDLTTLFNVTSNDIIYFSTPLTFDPSMVEILLACRNGASLLIAPEDPSILFPQDRKNSVTFWQTTPSKFFQHSNPDIRQKILGKNSTLRYLALGGEALFGIRRLKELKCPLNKTSIYVLYGVTEMSCWACATELDLEKIQSDKDVPLGECLSETQLHIEHNNKNKSYGKIMLSSKSRKCTILNGSNCNKNNNSVHHVDTGDLGEVRDNKVYFRGRKDDIIKRFGHKVNTKLIEMNVMKCPEVKQCSCIWLPKPSQLIVYYTSDTVKSKELLNYVKCKLDDKHWPDEMIRIDNLPINCHGKVSKQSLSSLYQDSELTKHPTTLSKLNIRAFFETQLKDIINSEIAYEQVKNKDFFSIGGTSFLAVTMCNTIAQSYPSFGQLLLPLLLARTNTIEMIIQKVEAKIFCTNKNMKRKKKVDIEGQSNIKKSSFDKNVSKKSSDQILEEKDVVEIRPIEFRVSWSYDTGKCVDASPTLFETKSKSYITVGSHSGKIVVLDTKLGNLLGLLEMNARVEAAVHCYQDASPRGIVGTHDGTIVCFSLDDVQKIWTLTVKHMIKSKAISCNKLAYVASYEGTIHCIKVSDGQLVKTINVSAHPISADLVCAKNEFVLLSSLSGDCAGLHVATNTVVWRQKLNSPVFSNPVVYDNDRYVIFTEINGYIYCKTVEKGLKVWQFHEAKGNIFSSLYIKELSNSNWQMTFGCYDKKIYSILIENFQPKILWTVEVSSQLYCTPCALTETLILAAANNGCLCVVDSRNGVIVDTFYLPNETFSSPTVFKDCIYIGCRNDSVYSLQYKINIDHLSCAVVDSLQVIPNK